MTNPQCLSRLKRVQFQASVALLLGPGSVVMVTELDDATNQHGDRALKGFDLELRAQPVPHVCVLGPDGNPIAQVPLEGVQSFLEGDLAHIAARVVTAPCVDCDKPVRSDASAGEDLVPRCKDCAENPSPLKRLVGLATNPDSPPSVAVQAASALIDRLEPTSAPERQLSRAERRAAKKAGK